MRKYKGDGGLIPQIKVVQQFALQIVDSICYVAIGSTNERVTCTRVPLNGWLSLGNISWIKTRRDGLNGGNGL